MSAHRANASVPSSTRLEGVINVANSRQLLSSSSTVRPQPSCYVFLLHLYDNHCQESHDCRIVYGYACISHKYIHRLNFSIGCSAILKDRSYISGKRFLCNLQNKCQKKIVYFEIDQSIEREREGERKRTVIRVYVNIGHYKYRLIIAEKFMPRIFSDGKNKYRCLIRIILFFVFSPHRWRIENVA